MKRLLLLVLVLATACSGMSQKLLGWRRDSYRSDARVTEKTVRVGTDDIRYLDRGAGEPVLLVHGFGGDKDNWTLAAAHLPEKWRVIALDLPGFGESSRDPAESHDARAQAARVVAFADALGLAKFHLAGNSMGGAISARIAIDHPERVSSLALVDAAGVKEPEPSDLAKELAAGRNPLVVKDREGFDRLMAFTFVKPPSVPGSIKDYFAERAVANAAFTEKIWGDLQAKPDRLEAELPKISARTLVLWGDADRILHPSSAGVFAAGIPGATVVTMEKCGHVPMLERPEEFAAKYAAFLEAK